jgi:hypothetical protein
VIAAGLAVAAVAVWLGVDDGRPSRSGPTASTPATPGARPGPPEVRFVDVAASAGIDFVHESGARGEKLLPETMGGGVAVLDHDGDGAPDLLFVNGRPWDDASPPAEPPVQRLYRNDGRGRFEDVTGATGVGLALYGMGAAVADHDGDGDDDVFLTALGPNVLLANEGGFFRDVTADAGVAGAADAWSTSAGFFDYDGDSDLDLFVCNYVRWSKTIDLELHFTLNGTDRAYGPPTHYEGTHSHLYRNEGDGTFRDVSAEAGVQIDHRATGRPLAKALGLTFVDVERDRHLDVLVANDTVQNFLFHNRGDGTFEEIGAAAGIGFDAAGKARGAMGIDAVRLERDDVLAIGIGNFAHEATSLYLSDRDPLRFTDEADALGIGGPSLLPLTFGLFFFDYDLDGRLDMLEANGHIETDIQEVDASQTYRQPAQLFWNAGGEPAAFVEVPADQTGDLSRAIVGRGAAYADLDADGDLDVVLTQIDGPPLVLRNDQRTGHHWLRVRLLGAPPNRDAIGAWVELRSDGHVQHRQVMPTRSYLSQVERVVTFGLGSSTTIDSLRVTWPDGTTQDVPDVEIDRLLVVRRAE